jgi:hypothetical protein
MAVEAKITGNGAFNGVSTSIADYNATEDATPTDPNDTSGGVGQLQIAVIEDPKGVGGTLSLLSDAVTLSDGNNGTTTGVVNQLSTNDGVSTVTANSRLSLLLNPTLVPPTSGTLEQVFRFYLSIAGITDSIVFTDGAYLVPSTTALSYPGWKGNMWDNMRQWAQAIGGEISLVSNDVVLRPLRTRTAVSVNDTTVTSTASITDLARTIKVNYYQNTYGVRKSCYPAGGWTPDVNVYQVGANETLQFNEPITASLVSVEQPTPVGTVSRFSTGSQYSIITSGGKYVDPGTWLKKGGDVSVTIGEDGASLDISITGAAMPGSPFRIGAQPAADDVYSTLRIVGTGNFVNMQTLSIATGIDPAKSVTDVGATIDNPFISTPAQAYSLGLITAGKYAGIAQNISVTTSNINRPDSSGNVRYPTFTDFNTGVQQRAYNYTGKTFADFTTNWSGKTFKNFNDGYFAYVRTDFINQSFGNVGGARRKYRDAFYRITTGTITPTEITYQADRDTTLADFDQAWQVETLEMSGPGARTTPYTLGDLDSILSRMTFSDFNASPLWRTYAGYAGRQPGRTPTTPPLTTTTTRPTSINLTTKG